MSTYCLNKKSHGHCVRRKIDLKVHRESCKHGELLESTETSGRCRKRPTVVELGGVEKKTHLERREANGECGGLQLLILK
jgi:hypothetical protein